MSTSIYVKDSANNTLAISTYSGLYITTETEYSVEEFFEEFGEGTGWVIIPGVLPSQLSRYSDIDDEGNLIEVSQIAILSSSELVALMKEHGIHTVFVTND